MAAQWTPNTYFKTPYNNKFHFGERLFEREWREMEGKEGEWRVLGSIFGEWKRACSRVGDWICFIEKLFVTEEGVGTIQFNVCVYRDDIRDRLMSFRKDSRPNPSHSNTTLRHPNARSTPLMLICVILSN